MGRRQLVDVGVRKPAAGRRARRRARRVPSGAVVLVASRHYMFLRDSKKNNSPLFLFLPPQNVTPVLPLLADSLNAVSSRDGMYPLLRWCPRRRKAMYTRPVVVRRAGVVASEGTHPSKHNFFPTAHSSYPSQHPPRASQIWQNLETGGEEECESHDTLPTTPPTAQHEQ